jgi:hypothetical protein
VTAYCAYLLLCCDWPLRNVFPSHLLGVLAADPARNAVTIRRVTADRAALAGSHVEAFSKHGGARAPSSPTVFVVSHTTTSVAMMNAAERCAWLSCALRCTCCISNWACFLLLITVASLLQSFTRPRCRRPLWLAHQGVHARRRAQLASMLPRACLRHAGIYWPRQNRDHCHLRKTYQFLRRLMLFWASLRHRKRLVALRYAGTATGHAFQPTLVQLGLLFNSSMVC